jgi:hypothetical protein
VIHHAGEQFARLKAELEDSFQGARNAGRPLLRGACPGEGRGRARVAGDEFVAARPRLHRGQERRRPRDRARAGRTADAARVIPCAAQRGAKRNGAPADTGPGDNTYSNFQEANRTFWRQTVLPLVNRTARALAAWLAPAWGEALALRPDLDAIEALTSEREALWARLDKASFLTIDEKRAAVGYGPVETQPLAGRDLADLM